MIQLQKALLACLLTFLFVAGITVTASADVTLKVGSNWVWSLSGDTVRVPITVDNPETIAGAAFTIAYDNTRLTLVNITSDFFDTFVNQWAALGLDPPENDTGYDQPLITNPIIDVGMAVAAARCTPAGAGGETTIFTLTFSLNTGADPGKYAVDIIATELNNKAAGYDPDGESIPMVVGADLSVTVPTDPNAFPVLTAADADPDAGYVAFYTDIDNDSLPDEWEEEQFGNIGETDGTEDSDNDGYSDAQEFANETDPEVKNDPDGDGYNENTDERIPKQQRIYTSPASPAAPPNSDFTMDVYYEAPETALDGIKLNIFFDSDVLSWNGISEEIGTPDVSEPISDDSNLDDDETTDWYVTVDYSLENNWPGASPMMLFAAGFTVADVSEGTTCNIKFDAEATGGIDYSFNSDLIEFEVRNYTLGDVNDDGFIDSGDAILVLRYSVGLISLTDIQKQAGNVTEKIDYNDIDSGDAIKILRYSVGLINEF